jgi:Spy/CpxP family protein refolding chaperone
MSDTPATRKAAIWVVVVFLMGAVAGGMLGYSYGYSHRSVAAASAPLSEPERRAKRVAQMTQELELTSDQAKQLDAILMQRHAEVKTIRDQSDAQLDQVRQRGRDQIRAILTPEQKPKFEEFLKKMDEERKRNTPR